MKIDIKNVGEYVVNIPENINVPDGTWVFGEYNGVRVGIIKNNGKIGTIIPDNSRQGCDLRDTTLEECIMYRGIKEEEGNLLPNIEGMVIEDCRLEGTIFKRCIMNGMDFTKTDIRGCTFEECSLEGCRFPAGQETCLDISEDQKETIHWVQGGKKS